MTIRKSLVIAILMWPMPKISRYSKYLPKYLVGNKLLLMINRVRELTTTREWSKRVRTNWNYIPAFNYAQYYARIARSHRRAYVWACNYAYEHTPYAASVAWPGLWVEEQKYNTAPHPMITPTTTTLIIWTFVNNYEIFILNQQRNFV